eukprot:SAG11_NODE_225_length_12064_cov_7.850815_12_plen_61_part_00
MRVGVYEIDLNNSLGEGGQINGPGEGVFSGTNTTTGQVSLQHDVMSSSRVKKQHNPATMQ